MYGLQVEWGEHAVPEFLFFRHSFWEVGNATSWEATFLSTGGFRTV